MTCLGGWHRACSRPTRTDPEACAICAWRRLAGGRAAYARSDLTMPTLPGGSVTAARTAIVQRRVRRTTHVRITSKPCASTWVRGGSQHLAAGRGAPRSRGIRGWQAERKVVLRPACGRSRP